MRASQINIRIYDSHDVDPQTQRCQGVKALPVAIIQFETFVQFFQYNTQGIRVFSGDKFVQVETYHCIVRQEV